jgi:hypothetical protein
VPKRRQESDLTNAATPSCQGGSVMRGSWIVVNTE